MVVDGVTDGTAFHIQTSPELPTVPDFRENNAVVPDLGTVTTVSHPLGQVPAFVHATLRCNDAAGEHGFAENDEIDLSQTWVSTGDDDQIVPLQVSYNATAIYITRNAQKGASDSGIQIMTRTGGVYSTLTDSKWRIKVYARVKQPEP